MKKRWLWLGLIVLPLGAIAALVFYRNPSVRGYLAGEPCFKGQPTSYWREQFRAANEHGVLPGATAASFHGTKDAVPVLLQCTHDQDARVRIAALNLLDKTGERSPEILDAFREALHDPDWNIRSGAVGTLSRWGPEASPALPDLLPLAQQADAIDAGYVKFALWRIDAATAASLDDWRPIPQDEWGFTAMMPAHVDIRKSEGVGVKNKAVVHYYDAQDDVNGYMISVGQYPEGFFGAMPLEARLDRARDASLLALAGKGVLEKEDPIEVQEHKGREMHVKLDEKHRMTLRVFCEGDRFYTLLAQTNESLPKEEAAAYFFDSFRFPQK